MKRLLGAMVLAAAVLLWGGCGREELQRYQFTDVAMGTVLGQSIYAADKAEAETLADGVLGLLEELERQEISWRLEGSGLFEINRSAGGTGGCLLSEDMTRLLTKCLELWKKSGGALDVTLLPIVRLWDIDTWAAADEGADFVPPGRELLEKTLALCGSGKLRLEPEIIGDNGEAVQARIFMPQGMELDLGAVGKGAALEKILGYLEQSQVKGAVISLGGSILTYGEKPDKSPWRVGIVNPRDASSNIALLSLEGQWCVSTSGDYERYAEAEGVRYHHIMDPDTGMPADSGVCSVTVLSRDGFLSDALSTACFILGVEKGMALAGQYGAETFFVTADGRIFMSEGMKQYLVKY